METKSDGKRFRQAFCIYDGDLMAEMLGGRIVAANSLQNMCYVSRRIPDTTTFRDRGRSQPLLTQHRPLVPPGGHQGRARWRHLPGRLV